VISAYKKWHDLKSLVSKHPTYMDYQAIKVAADAYWDAYKAFIDLQKNLLAQYSVPHDFESEWVATNILTHKRLIGS
ncbi:MAG: hypothetical protein WBM09_12400, partial [Gallionella sp.]